MAESSPGQRILLAGALLLFLDSFLPWQRSCVSLAPDFPLACSHSSAWTGSGFFAGSLMSILALFLGVAVGATVLKAVDPGERMPKVVWGLTIGTVVFGAIKFLYAAASHWAYGAWIGLLLMIALAFGANRKRQEDNAIPGR